jgi:tetratricopeptide (TPR) repeat protein
MKYIRPIICLVSCLFAIFEFSTSVKAQGKIIPEQDTSKMSVQDCKRAIPLLYGILKQNPTDYYNNFSLGKCLLIVGRPDSAIYYFTQALKISPNKFEAYVNRGVAYLGLKNYTSCETDEKKAISLVPELPEPYSNIGYCRLLNNDFKGSILYFDLAISKDRQFYQAYVNKAGALAGLKRPEVAIQVLSSVISMKPDYIKAYLNRVDGYLAIGEPDSAMADCNSILKIDSQNIEALLLRSKVKDEIGDNTGAIDDCNIAIAIDPNNAKLYAQRAYCRFDLKDNPRIVEDCNKAIQLDSNAVSAYIQRADALDELGEYDKAIADYERAIALEPGNFKPYRELPMTFYRKKDFKKCLLYINKGLAIEPKNNYLLNNKYNLQWMLGDHNGAFATLQQCIALHNDSAVFYYLAAAYLNDSIHRTNEACTNAFEALKLGAMEGYVFILNHNCPNFRQQPLFLASTQIQKAQHLDSLGSYFSEIETLTSAIQLLPEDGNLYYNRGLAKRKLNNFEEAIKDYTICIRLKPDFPAAIVARAVAHLYLKDTLSATRDFENCISVSPHYAMAYYNLGITVEGREPGRAIQLYSMAIQSDRKYGKAYLNRGKLYLNAGNKASACKDFQKADMLGIYEAKSLLYFNCK